MGIPLSCMGKDSNVVLKSVKAEKPLFRKLQDMGLCSDSVVSVLNKQSDGSVVLGTDGFKIAIDAMLARKILVQPV